MPKKEKKTIPTVGTHTLSKSEYSWLMDYGWIENYNQVKAIQAEIHDLKKLRNKTAFSPSSREDHLKLARIHYSEYQKERIAEIQEALMNCREQENPLRRLTKHGQLTSRNRGSQVFKSYVSWEEFEMAIKTLPENREMISEKERKKALDHIDQQLHKLQTKLDEIFPKHSRFREKPGGNDVRDGFINRWVIIQKQCCEPVAPSGIHLRHSHPIEQDAHKELHICDFVKADAPYMPISYD